MTIIKTILENPYSILQLPPTLWLPVYFSQAFQFLAPFNIEILVFFDKMIQITFSTNSTKASQSRLKIIFLRLPSKKQQPFKKVNFFFFFFVSFFWNIAEHQPTNFYIFQKYKKTMLFWKFTVTLATLLEITSHQTWYFALLVFLSSPKLRLRKRLLFDKWKCYLVFLVFSFFLH